MLLIVRLSRCSIGPAGQFTIGTNNNTILATNTSHVSTSVLLDHDEALTASKSPARDSNNPPKPKTTSSNENDLQEPPIEAIPSVSDADDDFSDFMPSQTVPSRRGSLVNDVWKMEDPYDSHENRSIPYKRGDILLNKSQILRRLERTKQRKEVEKRVSKANEKDSLFVYPSGNLSVFT